jgi:hypothetical protein
VLIWRANQSFRTSGGLLIYYFFSFSFLWRGVKCGPVEIRILDYRIHETGVDCSCKFCLAVLMNHSVFWSYIHMSLLIHRMENG